ncbi:metal ABC transporter permease [Corynebacterium epidermidicanis]|uniref:ABC-type Mn2+/Zn2+ transport system, permease component n=1 Tax=Corynebacterium epidermidicanis TaxID=1050174 RepID=A0A0G3GU72_9CORY|nr:metal ABC transporter permease [Corynebacterium epidermidicanis]AKK02412.1 ABC-type Mn2+/Zn2+ transport system, permease component [Corynebacterium epidermidicanis]
MNWWEIHFWPLAEVLVLGAGTGLVGALALLHRRIFFAEAISHASFPGAVIGVVLAASLSATQLTGYIFLGAFAGCVALALLMRALVDVPGLNSQSAAGIVLSSGFAFGYFLANWFKPLPIRVDSFLTGSVVSVGRMDVYASVAVALTALLVVAAFGSALISMAFDQTLFRAAGGATRRLDALVLLLICAVIVVAIPAVGTIVVIALLAAPAASVQPWVRSPVALLCWSPILGVLVGGLGFALAVQWGLSVGGTIAIVCGGCFTVSQCGHQLATSTRQPSAMFRRYS